MERRALPSQRGIVQQHGLRDASSVHGLQKENRSRTSMQLFCVRPLQDGIHLQVQNSQLRIWSDLAVLRKPRLSRCEIKS